MIWKISLSTVQRIPNGCYPNFKVNKEYFPKTICIHEFKPVKNIDSAMSFVFADYQTKNIIDIVEDRRLNSLTENFSRFLLEDYCIYLSIREVVNRNCNHRIYVN